MSKTRWGDIGTNPEKNMSQTAIISNIIGSLIGDIQNTNRQYLII
jgi:hypothetical protein